MRSSTLAALTVIVLVASLAERAMAQAAPPAAATAKPTAADLREAKTRSDLGAKLQTEHLYEAAIPELESAYRLGGRAADLQKIAECHRAMNAFDVAYVTYDKLLTAHARDLSARQQAVVKKAMTELEALTGVVMIKTSPEAAVMVSAGERAIGTTPISTPVRLNAGPQHLRFSKEGFESLDKDIVVAAAQTAAVEATLDGRVVTAHLAVKETAGQAVHVFVDGADMGGAPWQGDVAAGEHTIALRGPTAESEARTVKVARKSSSDLSIEAKATIGHLHLRLVPKGAEVRVDGEPAGKGTLDKDLKPGDHEIAVSAPGYEPTSKSFSLKAGQSLEEEISLKPVAAPPVDDAERFQGAYGEASLLGTFPVHTLAAPECDGLPANGNCDHGASLGGGFALRGGYSLGWLGIEGVAAFHGNTQKNTLTYGPNGAGTTLAPVEANTPHQETYQNVAAGGFVGAGVRVSPPGKYVRFEAGLAGGVVGRAVFQRRELSGGLADASVYSDRYFAPGMMGDLSVSFSTTPGLRFIMGLVAIMDAPAALKAPALSRPAVNSGPTGGTVDVPIPEHVLINGMQLYIGPQIGIRFGH